MLGPTMGVTVSWLACNRVPAFHQEIRGGGLEPTARQVTCCGLLADTPRFSLRSILTLNSGTAMDEKRWLFTWSKMIYIISPTIWSVAVAVQFSPKLINFEMISFFLKSSSNSFWLKWRNSILFFLWRYNFFNVRVHDMNFRLLIPSELAVKRSSRKPFLEIISVGSWQMESSRRMWGGGGDSEII